MTAKKLLKKIVKNWVIYDLPTNAEYVDKETAQSVGGKKTFTTEPAIPAKNSDADSSKTTSPATESQVAKKQDVLTAGENISISVVNWVLTISATDTKYSQVTKNDMIAGTWTTPGIVSAKDLNEFVESKISSWVVYKWQVQNYAALPSSDVSVGDMYNVVEAHTTAPKFDAWTNVVWNGTGWDPMAEMVDLSNLVDKTTNQTIWWEKIFTTSPIVPSKSSDAWNNPTSIATEAQVAKKLDSSDLGNATISVKYAKKSTAVGSFTTNQSSAWEVVVPWEEFLDQDDFDELPASKSSDDNSYWIFEEIGE